MIGRDEDTVQVMIIGSVLFFSAVSNFLVIHTLSCPSFTVSSVFLAILS